MSEEAYEKLTPKQQAHKSNNQGPICPTSHYKEFRPRAPLDHNGEYSLNILSNDGTYWRHIKWGANICPCKLGFRIFESFG